MQTIDFLKTFFGDITEEGFLISVFSPGKGNRQFSDLEKATSYGLSTVGNVYFGLGATKKIIPQENRTCISDIDAIFGYWIDLDIAGPTEAHKASNLPTTREDALDVAKQAIPLEPSLIVNSGYGLHVYWLFKEPWVFDTDEERDAASVNVRKFVLSVKYHAAMRGWRTDSVFDISRVLRLPGSKNCKVEGSNVSCEVEFSGTARYNPDDFDKFFVSDDAANTNEGISALLSKDKNPLGLSLSANAIPPFEKFENIIGMEERFRRSWNKERTDLKDQSMSGYELSIASFCVSYGWTDQEIADTLIRFRKKYTDEKKFRKGLRIDYITRTILRAKKKSKVDDTDDVAGNLAQRAEESKADKESAPPTRDEISAALETLLKVNISKIVKVVTDVPKFEIHFSDKTVIQAGTIDSIISQSKLRSLIAAHKGVLPRVVKAKVWDEYATLLLQLVEEVQASEESTIKGAILQSIRHYIEEVGIASEWQYACKIKRPFVRDGKTYIFSSAYVNWARVYSDKISTRELAVELAAMGFKAMQMKFNMGSDDSPKPTTRSVYEVTLISKDLHPCEMPGLSLVETIESGHNEVQQ